MKQIKEWRCGLAEPMIGHEETMKLGEDGKPKPLTMPPMDGGPKCVRKDENCKKCEHGKLEIYNEYPGYFDGKKEFYDFEGADHDELFEHFDGNFHVGNDGPSTQVKCKKCGSTNFEVGMSSYMTVLRCPKCKYEYGMEG